MVSTSSRMCITPGSSHEENTELKPTFKVINFTCFEGDWRNQGSSYVSFRKLFTAEKWGFNEVESEERRKEVHGESGDCVSQDANCVELGSCCTIASDDDSRGTERRVFWGGYLSPRMTCAFFFFEYGSRLEQ